MSAYSKPVDWLLVSTNNFDPALLEQSNLLIDRAFGLASLFYDLRDCGPSLTRNHKKGFATKLRDYQLFADKFHLASLIFLVSFLPIRSVESWVGGGIYGLGSPLAEFDDLTRVAAKE
tara:strand:- start:273 stop:626 length:354 start_codon:yes stop_codon:yes gene_type:complete